MNIKVTITNHYAELWNNGLKHYTSEAMKEH